MVGPFQRREQKAPWFHIVERQPETPNFVLPKATEMADNITVLNLVSAYEMISG
jgi:hypothetical protein